MSFIPPYQETAAILAAQNPLVPRGVIASETDTGVIKVGDGVTRYNSLATALGATYAPLSGTSTKTRILVIGSSNAFGAGASTTANSWVGLLTTALTATHTITNIAVAGTAAAYWVAPDATGRTPLEQAIITYRPHIVIGALTCQNDGGPTTAHIGYVESAYTICGRYGIRYIGITPYISSGYAALTKDKNWQIVESLKRRNIPLLHFASIWGKNSTIPAAIDTGDGLHINDAGHLEQYRQIPQDWLYPTSSVGSAKFSAAATGVLIPTVTTGPFTSANAFPAGSCTVSFRFTPAASWSKGLFSGADSSGGGVTRLRTPGASQLDCAGKIVHPAQTIAAGTEYHVALTYNAITSESFLYVNGVLVSTVTAATGNPVFGTTSFTLGDVSNVANGSLSATGYRFRNFAIHSTILDQADILRLMDGDVKPISTFYAASLQDGAARAVGAWFASDHGTSTVLTINNATA